LPGGQHGLVVNRTGEPSGAVAIDHERGDARLGEPVGVVDFAIRLDPTARGHDHDGGIRPRAGREMESGLQADQGDRHTRYGVGVEAHVLDRLLSRRRNRRTQHHSGRQNGDESGCMCHRWHLRFSLTTCAGFLEPAERR
jgi:hypothetical protein